METSDFKALALNESLLTVIAELGFTEPTEIQAKAIPVLLAGRDLIGQSQTGTGKTAAFTLPILNQLSLTELQIQALVLCPTRELCAQVARDIKRLGRAMSGLQILAAAGGQPGKPQADVLENGVHIVVATPGRFLDHMERGRLNLDQLQTVVLDEADKMLEMGFEKEINAIFANLPRERQTVLFSATFPETIENLSRRFQKKPERIVIEKSKDISAQIEQIRYDHDGEEKLHLLMRILQQHPSQSTIIFCNQKSHVAAIGAKLEEAQVNAAVLHGDLDQRDRDRVLTLFRNGSHRILVATDVAGRGLDIENLELVVNYDLPQTPDVYVHRIGRTGRAGKTGTAVSIVEKSDGLKIHEFEKATGQKMLPKQLGFKNQHGLGSSFQTAAMQTLSVSGGKKDKLRPGDILGALTGGKNPLAGADIGKIDVQDRFTYVAVNTKVAKIAFEKLRDERIKGHKFQIKMVK